LAKIGCSSKLSQLPSRRELSSKDPIIVIKGTKIFVSQRTSSIAPLLVFPGEDELELLAAGGASVLRQKEIVKE
jgi:hypothetical protein